MADDDLKSAYIRAIGFNPEVEPRKAKRALSRAHQYRTLEIDLYWKRATYFWAFQGAIFAGFGLVLSRLEWKEGLVLLVLCIAGGLTAVTGMHAARGAKFWQENWEKHVDMLETCFEGNLHKTVWLPEGKGSYSVTQLNERLNGWLLAVWIVLGGVTLYRSCVWPWDWPMFFTVQQVLRGSGVLVGVIGVVLGLIFPYLRFWPLRDTLRLWRAKSNLTGSRFNPVAGRRQAFGIQERNELMILRRRARWETWDLEKGPSEIATKQGFTMATEVKHAGADKPQK